MQPSSCFFLFDGWLLVMLRTMMIILVVSSDFLVAGWCACVGCLDCIPWFNSTHILLPVRIASQLAGCLAAGVLTANTRTKNG